MLTDLLNKILKKQPVVPQATKPAPTAATKAPEKKKNQANDLLFKAIGGVLVVGVLFMVTDQAADNAEQAEMGAVESVIPLAQLTGQVGVKPKKETLEQQFRRENKNVPLSDGSAIPKNIVETKTRLFRQVPFGDNELAYELRLPTDWVQSKFGEYGKPEQDAYAVLTNIDRYFGPAIGDQRPFVWLETEKLTRTTSAAHYRDLYLIKRGIAPEAVQQNDGTRAEALYVEQKDYATYAVRALFILNGDLITVVTFGVPLLEYKNLKDLMGLTLSSYRQLNVIDRPVEKITTHKLLNVTTFNYPDRWVVQNENRMSSLTPSLELILPTELRLAMQKFDPLAELDGLILINVWRNTPNFNDEVLERTIVKRLEQGHLRLSTVLQPKKPLPLHGDLRRVSRAIYVGIVDPTIPTVEEYGIVRDDSAFPRQEVWVTILDNGAYTAAVTLVTWPQTKEYRSWSYNIETYDMIINSMKLRSLDF